MIQSQTATGGYKFSQQRHNFDSSGQPQQQEQLLVESKKIKRKKYLNKYLNNNSNYKNSSGRNSARS